MTPEMVGHRRRLKLGKHVGRHAIKEMLGQAQIYPDSTQTDEIMVRVKEIAAKGRQVTDNDLYVIAESVLGRKAAARTVELDDILITTGNHSIPTATVKAMVNGTETICCHTGDGPIDAAMKAILGIAPTGVHLKDFAVQAISGGTDAIAHVTIAVENNRGQVYDAGASGEDVVIASAEAMVQALNIVSRMDGAKKQDVE
jgi:2-isopropylmalate synthase